MAKHLTAKTLAQSAAISLFLAASAMAQSWIGSPPPQQIYISITSVSGDNSSFTPAVQIEDGKGHLTVIPIGQDGLTRAILFNQSDITAWVLQRYGQAGNTQVFYTAPPAGNNQPAEQPPPTPTPTPTPETPTPTPETPTIDPPTIDDCLHPISDVKKVADLPLVLVQVLPCDAQPDPCDTYSFDRPHLPMILRVADPCANIVPPVITLG